MDYEKSKDWHKISKEYKQEIENIWNDMLTVSQIITTSQLSCEDLCIEDVEEIMRILDNSFLSSKKVVHEIEKFN